MICLGPAAGVWNSLIAVVRPRTSVYLSLTTPSASVTLVKKRVSPARSDPNAYSKVVDVPSGSVVSVTRSRMSYSVTVGATGSSLTLNVPGVPSDSVTGYLCSTTRPRKSNVVLPATTMTSLGSASGPTWMVASFFVWTTRFNPSTKTTVSSGSAGWASSRCWVSAHGTSAPGRYSNETVGGPDGSWFGPKTSSRRP